MYSGGRKRYELNKEDCSGVMTSSEGWDIQELPKAIMLWESDERGGRGRPNVNWTKGVLLSIQLSYEDASGQAAVEMQN